MTKSELREIIRECLREELSKTTLKEAASLTYNELAKKFDAAIAEADTNWIVNLIDAGLDDGYYAAPAAKVLEDTADRNIANGMREADAIDLCHTGLASLDNEFEQFMKEEAENFDSRFDFNNMLYICYADGTYKYFDSYEDNFTGDLNDIECLIGVDYTSGASICWIRGEDDAEELNHLLNLTESDNSSTAVVLGKTVLDFNSITSVAQLEAAFEEYYDDMDNNLSYNEYVTQFVPSLLNNPAVPAWAKKLFESSTDVNSIAMAGGDETDDVVAACYQAIEDCGYDPEDYNMDDIGEFIANQAVYGFFIEGNTLYVYISTPECDLDVDFVRDYLGLNV